MSFGLECETFLSETLKRKGYVWVVRSVMNKSVFYYYQEGSRSRETLLKMLKDYQGALQSDGYAAYSIYEDKQGVLPLGCMAHVRRKFENALATTPDAQQALEYISLLSAKKMGIEPIKWFNHALSRINDNTTEEDLEKLLPKHYPKKQ